MEARDRRLPHWLTRIATRQVVLPRFQRMEAWGYREVADLLHTALHELPAGITLVLEVGNAPAFPWRPIIGAPDKGERISEQLLDGQQRLTALWRSLTDDYPDRTYFVVLPDVENPDEEPYINPLPRWTKGTQRFPVWADSPSKCWERRHVPVRLLRPDDKAENALWDWASEAADGDPQRQNEIIKAVNPLRTRFASFNLPFLALGVGTAREVALEVFIKMNTRTVRLTAFDIVVAQVEEAAGQSLHDLVKGLDGSVPEMAAYDSLKDLALSVAALLQDRTPNVAGWMGLDFDQMISDWSKIERGAKAAVRFLAQERVPDQQRLPTITVMPSLVALWSEVPDHPDARGNAQTLLRKYLWRAFFTDRYERAAATAAYQDYRALRSLITGSSSTVDVPIFDNKRHPCPEQEMLIQAGWPKKRDRLARAILLLSLRGGAHDIADGAEATREHLAHREYHHLYPRAHLRDEDYAEGLADRALNCALITWKTNRVISAKDPMTYLRERADASTLGEAEIRRRLATHAIPFASLTAGDYDGFLADRAALLHPAIQALCDGKPWFPSELLNTVSA